MVNHLNSLMVSNNCNIVFMSNWNIEKTEKIIYDINKLKLNQRY
jgi:hypothetical protein